MLNKLIHWSLANRAIIIGISLLLIPRAPVVADLRALAHHERDQRPRHTRSARDVLHGGVRRRGGVDISGHLMKTLVRAL